ncbi:MAG TPA: cytochrome c oxidase subunit 3 [Calidithermus sp.]|nr:cytochrome c oxidase subunit 3 [Calidithermus sp.]
MAVRVAEAPVATAGTGGRVEPGKMGMWWFLASEIMVFGGLIGVYLVFRLGGTGWSAEAAHLQVTIGVVNTLVLLTSSLTVVQAYAAAAAGDGRAAGRFLGLTVLGGLLFLAFKTVEYTTEVRAGFTPADGIFWSFYYTMTGLHALHVLAGVVANVVLLARRPLRTAHRLELAGLYWHFVDIVWIFLFPLLYLS